LPPAPAWASSIGWITAFGSVVEKPVVGVRPAFERIWRYRGAGTVRMSVTSENQRRCTS
jgi:hypothetical protein